MRLVVQRSLNSSVSVDQKIVGKIDSGIVVLVGFTYGDTIDDILYLVNKFINLRIFDDEYGVMNKSLLDINGEILSISQFTLYADTKGSGRRPSYAKALKRDEAIKLYEIFNNILRENNVKVEEGVFGADMKLSITNDGPVTIILESGN